MQALFYGIGAAVIGIIAIAAYKLSRTTNKRDPLLWGIFAGAARHHRADARGACAVLHRGRSCYIVRQGATRLAQNTRAVHCTGANGHPCPLSAGLAGRSPAWRRRATANLAVFHESRCFCVGSGLAIVPFLYQGVGPAILSQWTARAQDNAALLSRPRVSKRTDAASDIGVHSGSGSWQWPSWQSQAWPFS